MWLHLSELHCFKNTGHTFGYTWVSFIILRTHECYSLLLNVRYFCAHNWIPQNLVWPARNEVTQLRPHHHNWFQTIYVHHTHTHTHTHTLCHNIQTQLCCNVIHNLGPMFYFCVNVFQCKYVRIYCSIYIFEKLYIYICIIMHAGERVWIMALSR